MGERQFAYTVLVREPEGRTTPGIDGGIIMKLIFRELDGRCRPN
jgi:hypothetical protein